jgi:predicted house-cleaning NTP pyrophosphatase (Maf/HAM1 superfamily)
MSTTEEPLSYSAARALAFSDDAQERLLLASRCDIPQEFLYLLAQDSDATVRQRIANNQATPHKADLVLASDNEDIVRGAVAEKITDYVNAAEARGEQALSSTMGDILNTLVRDPITSIRARLSTAFQKSTLVPKQVVKTLANDKEASVASPVLQHSPQMLEADFVEIISANPSTATFSALAQRADLSGRVVSAIVGSDNDDGIAALLNNPHLALEPETIEALISQAEKHPKWLAGLANRTDFESPAGKRLAQLAKAQHHNHQWQLSKELEPFAKQVWQDYQNNALNENRVAEAVASKNRPYVICALALLSSREEMLVERLFKAQSPKAVAGLCWEAKITAQLAYRIQTSLIGIRPGEALQPVGGKYPLRPQELQWHLELFTDLCA